MPCIPSLCSTHSAPIFTEKFFAPLLELLAHADNQRGSPELTDEDCLCVGLRHTFEDWPSGRVFLQHLILSGEERPEQSHFFETLKSARRLALVSEVSTALAAVLPALPGDWCTRLAAFDVYVVTNQRCPDSRIKGKHRKPPRLRECPARGGAKRGVDRAT